MNEEELKEAARDARRALDRKREEIRERLELMEGFSHTLEATEELLAENESLKDELESGETAAGDSVADGRAG